MPRASVGGGAPSPKKPKRTKPVNKSGMTPREALYYGGSKKRQRSAAAQITSQRKQVVRERVAKAERTHRNYYLQKRADVASRLQHALEQSGGGNDEKLNQIDDPKMRRLVRDGYETPKLAKALGEGPKKAARGENRAVVRQYLANSRANTDLKRAKDKLRSQGVEAPYKAPKRLKKAFTEEQRKRLQGVVKKRNRKGDEFQAQAEARPMKEVRAERVLREQQIKRAKRIFVEHKRIAKEKGPEAAAAYLQRMANPKPKEGVIEEVAGAVGDAFKAVAGAVDSVNKSVPTPVGTLSGEPVIKPSDMTKPIVSIKVPKSVQEVNEKTKYLNPIGYETQKLLGTDKKLEVTPLDIASVRLARPAARATGKAAKAVKRAYLAAEQRGGKALLLTATRKNARIRAAAKAAEKAREGRPSFGKFNAAAPKKPTKFEVAKQVPKSLFKQGKGHAYSKGNTAIMRVNTPAVSVETLGGIGAVSTVAMAGIGTVDAAIKHGGHPWKVTGQNYASIVPALTSMAADAGTSALRAAKTGLVSVVPGVEEEHTTDFKVPGTDFNLGDWHIVRYSKDSITAPLRGQARQQLDYFGPLVDLVIAHEYHAENGKTYTDESAWSAAVNEKYGFTLVPSTFLLGKGGMRAFHNFKGVPAEISARKSWVRNQVADGLDRIAAASPGSFMKRRNSFRVAARLERGKNRAGAKSSGARDIRQKGNVKEAAAEAAFGKLSSTKYAPRLERAAGKLRMIDAKERVGIALNRSDIPRDPARAEAYAARRVEEIQQHPDAPVPGESFTEVPRSVLPAQRAKKKVRVSSELDLMLTIRDNPWLVADPVVLNIHKRFKENAPQTVLDQPGRAQAPAMKAYGKPLLHERFPRSKVLEVDPESKAKTVDQLEEELNLQAKELERAALDYRAFGNPRKFKTKESRDEATVMKRKAAQDMERLQPIVKRKREILRGRLTAQERKALLDRALALYNEKNGTEFKSTREAVKADRAKGGKNANDTANSFREIVKRATAIEGRRRLEREMLPGYERDFRALAREHNLDPNPVYIRDKRVDEAHSGPKTTDEYNGLPANPLKRWEGKIQEEGSANRDAVTAINDSIIRPSYIEAQYFVANEFLKAHAARLSEVDPNLKGAMRKAGVRENAVGEVPVYVGRDLRKLRERSPEAARLLDTYVQLPLSDVKRALEKRPDLEDITLQEYINDNQALADAAAGGAVNYAKGERYVLVKAGIGREFADQWKQMGTAIEGVRKATRFQSKITLGMSPAWAAWQVPAEFTQATIAGGRRMVYLPNDPVPKQISRVGRSFEERDPSKHISKTDQSIWESEMGSGAGPGTIPYGQSTNTVGLDVRGGNTKFKEHDPGPFDYDRAAKLMDLMGRTYTGRALKSVAKLEPLGLFDQWKGTVIRSRLGRAHLDRELNGMLNNMPSVLNLTEATTKHLRSMRKADGSPDLKSQMEYILHDPKGRAAVTTIAEYVDDMLGNWKAFTAKEKIPSSMLFFYPFLRMSVKWTLYSLPKHHPMRAAILYQLGGANASAVRELYGGDVQFLNMLFESPLHGHGKPIDRLGNIDEGVIKGVNVARMSPTGSLPFEFLNNPSNPGILLNALPPAYSNFIGAIIGVDPLTGRRLVPEGGWQDSSGRVLQPSSQGTGLNRSKEVREGLTPAQRAAYYLNRMMGLAAPYRLYQSANPVNPTDFPWGQRMKVSQLSKALGVSDDIRTIKSAGLPVITDLGKVKDRNQFYDIIDKIGNQTEIMNEARKYQAMPPGKQRSQFEAQYNKAQASRDRMFSSIDKLSIKYGVKVKPYPYRSSWRRREQTLEDRLKSSPWYTGDSSRGTNRPLSTAPWRKQP